MNKEINNKKKKKFKKVLGTSKYINKTFASKLFIKLTESIIDKRIICFQILQFELENRKRVDILKASPYLSNSGEFYNYVCLNEKQNDIPEILNELTWLLFYKYYKSGSIIKRPNQFNEKFYIIMSGKVEKLSLVFKKECLSLEEYLIFIIKMKIINEKGIINKCRALNQSIFHKNDNLDFENMKYFFEKNKKKYNYDKLYAIAFNELIEEGFHFNYDKNTFNISSIDTYYKIGKIGNNIFKNLNNKSKVMLMFWIPHYEKISTLEKGCTIGDLTNDFNEENYAYIAVNNCDILYINKSNNAIDTKVYQIFEKKKKSIFTNIKNKFFLFQNLRNEILFNKYVPKMIYKKYKKGEKIFFQNSLYDGIYLINEGEIKIYVDLLINDIPQFLLDLKYSFNDFKNYYYSFKVGDILNSDKELKKNILGNPLFTSKDYSNIFLKPQEIFLTTMKEGEIIGLNEFYNYKTKLFNFSAECISDSAQLFFLPSKYLSTLINIHLKNNVIDSIESKLTFFIGKINNFKTNFLKKSLHIIKTLKRFKMKDEPLLTIKKDSIISNKNMTYNKDKFGGIETHNKLYTNMNITLNDSNKINSNNNSKNIFKNNKTYMNFTMKNKNDINYTINDDDNYNLKTIENNKYHNSNDNFFSFTEFKIKKRNNEKNLKNHLFNLNDDIYINTNINTDRTNYNVSQFPYSIEDYELNNKGLYSKDINEDIHKRFHSIDNYKFNQYKELSLKKNINPKNSNDFLYLPKIKIKKNKI